MFNTLINYNQKNVNTPKKVTLPVAKEIRKLRKRESSDSEIIHRLLEADGLTKSAAPKNNVKENSDKFTRQFTKK